MKNFLLLALTAISLSVSAQLPSYIPANEIEGWWPFNGNANDESGNGHNGTPLGNVSLTQDRNGIANSAYSFDGIDDYIISPTATGYVSDSISISFWISYNADFSYFSLIAFGGSPSIRWGAGCGYTTLRATVGSVCGGTGNLLNYNTSAGWHNVVYVITNTNQDIYYDGNYVGSESNSLMSSLSCDISNLWFGVDIASAAEYYDGKLDDIGIWHRALTPSEITTIYQGCQVSITTQPTNQTALAGSNVQFTTATSNANATFQWQTDLGTGFVNVTNAGQYNGATNDTLSISNVSATNDNQNFRCIITDGACTDTTNSSVLTVTPTGISTLENKFNFSIYPNPANEILFINTNFTSVNSNYFISDAIGKTIISGTLDGKTTQVSTTNLSEGIYIFQCGSFNHLIFIAK